MVDASKGDLVQIHLTILEPADRPVNLPESTREVPYETWIKGFLINSTADIGDQAEITTFAGRKLQGALSAVYPVYDHDFGEPQPELLTIGQELSARLSNGEG